MYFILDLICAAIILGVMVRYWSHAVSHVLLKCLCVALSMSIAAVASAPLADYVSEAWTTPYVENRAANGLAELLAADSGTNGRETVAALSCIGDLIEEEPEPYLQWLHTYAALPEEAASAYGKDGDAVALLQAVTGEYSRDLTRGAVYLVLTVILFLLCSFIASKLEWNMTEPRRYRGIVRAIPPLCGALCGVLIVMQLTLCLEWIVPPLSGDSMLLSTDMLQKGTVYPALKWLNPFIWLYF